MTTGMGAHRGARRLWLAAVVLPVAAAAVLAPGWFGARTVADPGLLRLLLLMAGVKSLLAAGAVAVIAWRLGHPASRALAAGWVATAALLAAGAGLMWHPAADLAGAVVFYAGVAGLLGLGWADGAGDGAWFASALRRRAAARDARARRAAPGGRTRAEEVS